VELVVVGTVIQLLMVVVVLDQTVAVLVELVTVWNIMTITLTDVPVMSIILHLPVPATLIWVVTVIQEVIYHDGFVLFTVNRKL
jgi:hypothetical protein